ncbi:MAG: hypothetical protein EXR93_02065 [Gemmatimonadetes bacterium]|nr:hypothetical protein [Gemmatimonadota bacterium]
MSRAELLRAMRLHGNYNLVATPNLARFQTDVFLQLARWARSRSPQGDPLFVGPEDWFQGYAEVTGVTRETAPEAIRRALEVGQLTQLDYRTDHVIEEPGDGPKPLNAMNVRIWWEPIPSGPSKYSYRDTISTPNLSVTNQQMITFRLLEFDDKIVYDQVRGLSGRPTTGLLGLLFRLIGEGEVVESRMTISTDGLQIVVARSKKVFTVPVTATVHPDGRGEKGVPDGRADLEAIEGRLRRPVPVRYVPYAC